MLRLPRLLSSLTLRMALTLTSLILVAAGFITLSITRETALNELQAQQRAGEHLLQQVVPIARAWLSQNNLDELEHRLRVWGEDPAVASLRLTDGAGVTVFDQQRPQPPLGAFLATLTGAAAERQVTAEINVGGVQPGQLQAVLTNTPIEAHFYHNLQRAGLITLGVMLATFVVGYWWLRRCLAPLKALAAWTREFAHGNFSPRVELVPSSCRELRELNQSFAGGAAAMRHHIQRLEETRDLLEHNEARLQHIADNMHEILFELDGDGRLIMLNPAWQTLTGYTLDEALGHLLTDFLLEQNTLPEFQSEPLPPLPRQDREIALRTATGRPLWVRIRAATQLDRQGEFAGVIGTLSDVTRRVELERLLSRYQDELYQLSITDPLTGLYNRRHFDTQLETILAGHLHKNESVCLLLIDLDGFKFINDTYGHPFGDEVLRTTAELLRRQVRRNDYIARMAGDEFAMVLKNTDLDSATRIAKKLHAKISATRVPLPVGSMQIQSSIGVAEAPTHGANAQELVSAADVALYHTKRQGRNRIEVLSPDMSQAMITIFSQGFQLRQALEQGHLHPAFQPIYDMRDGTVVAYEVLARMRLNGAVIQAKDFIAVAEELGLTRELDLYIIRAALNRAPADYMLFLNVDLSSFADRDFVHELAEVLRPACLAGRRITIEITERETIPISDALQEDIQTLRALGCRLALDDFGSGYSTYNFLNQLHPDYLKIEGAFVRGMLENESDHKIVTHIHELAVSFGIETIAECVENEATLTALRDIGIRNGQGYYYGEPCLVT